MPDETMIAELLRAAPGWTRSGDGKSIARSYIFVDFAGAFALVRKIAERAEAAGHHPDIAFGWGRVDVTLTTHESGGLTGKDFALAREIDDAQGV